MNSKLELLYMFVEPVHEAQLQTDTSQNPLFQLESYSFSYEHVKDANLKSSILTCIF